MYTAQMKKAVRELKAPKDFEIGIVDYGQFLTIQFYESHWRHLSDPERLRCIKYMEAVKQRLELLGARVALDPILDVKYNDDRKI